VGGDEDATLQAQGFAQVSLPKANRVRVLQWCEAVVENYLLGFHMEILSVRPTSAAGGARAPPRSRRAASGPAALRAEPHPWRPGPIGRSTGLQDAASSK
jgi:hypothetical protein